MSRLTQTDVSRETHARLRAFVELLCVWNKRINLVGTSEPEEIWKRHVEDALQLISLIPSSTQAGLDIGSGGGFPGLVLGIATGIPFTLVEADQRKAAFLREAARLDGGKFNIQATRIDALPYKADLITARAVASLSTLLAWAQPHLDGEGVCLFPKGQSVHVEIEEAARLWSADIEQYRSATDESGTILRVSKIRDRAPSA